MSRKLITAAEARSAINENDVKVGELLSDIMYDIEDAMFDNRDNIMLNVSNNNGFNIHEVKNAVKMLNALGYNVVQKDGTLHIKW